MGIEAQSGRSRRCDWVDDPFTDELCSNFSLLALPHVFRVEISTLRRFIWLVIFLGGSVASLLFTVKLIQDYLKFESATLVLTKKPDKDGLVFPAVTIWNINPVRLSAVNASTEYYEAVCSRRPNVNDEMVFSKQGLPEDWTPEWRVSAAHQLSEMLLECEFKGVPCSVNDFDVALTPTPNVRWGVGYTFNFHSTTKTATVGSRGGLHMALDIQLEEYCPRTWGSGFRVQFHDHEDLPTDEIARSHIDPHLGVTVSPGSRWSFALRRIEHHALGEPYGPPCIDLRGGDEYPDPLATFDCVEENCPNSDASNITEINLLSHEDPCVRECFEPRTFRFCDGATFEYDLGGEVLDLHIPDGQSLTEQDLDILRESTLVGNHINESSTVRDAKEIQDHLSRDIVVLDVFYKELLYEDREVVPQSSIWVLFAEIGGILGLFLGVSMVTIFEAFEISSILCCSFADKSTRFTRSDLVEKYAIRGKKGDRLDV